MADSAQFCTSCGAPKSNGTSAEAPARPAFEPVEIGVPHCDAFSRTADGLGFTVTFLQGVRINGLYILIVFVFALVIAFSLHSKDWRGPVCGFLVLALGIGGPFFLTSRTSITVTPDTVVIQEQRNQKVLSRNHFAAFSSNGSRLQYTYGMRVFTFGGQWDYQRATEITTALNHHLRQIPTGTATRQPSSDVLRNVRPTDF